MNEKNTPLGAIPQTGFLRLKQIIPSIVPVTKPTLLRWSKAGNFPKPVKIGPRSTGWRCEEVRAWVEAQGRSQAA